MPALIPVPILTQPPRVMEYQFSLSDVYNLIARAKSIYVKTISICHPKYMSGHLYAYIGVAMILDITDGA